MLTLLQCATLSGWEEALYTNQFGCDRFPGALYRPALAALAAGFGVADPAERIVNFAGDPSLPAPACVSPQAQPLAAALYFGSFTAITAFIILSLFVGIITLSMLDQMETHIRSKNQRRRAAEFREQLQASLDHVLEARAKVIEQLRNSSMTVRELSAAAVTQLANRAMAREAVFAQEEAARKARKKRGKSLRASRGEPGGSPAGKGPGSPGRASPGRGPGSPVPGSPGKSLLDEAVVRGVGAEAAAAAADPEAPEAEEGEDEEAGPSSDEGGEGFGRRSGRFFDMAFTVDFTTSKHLREAEARKPLLKVAAKNETKNSKYPPLLHFFWERQPSAPESCSKGSPCCEQAAVSRPLL